MAPRPPDAILEAALYVSDLTRAAGFYGGDLGLEEVVRVEGRHIFYGCGAGMVLLFCAEATRQPSANPTLPVPTHGATGPGHLCFRVAPEALGPWRTHLEARGHAIEADFRWPNGARSIYLRDPDGNSIEFSEAKLWGRSGA